MVLEQPALLVADLLRLFAGVTILTFASWTDWRWRRAPNVLWLILAGVGVVALAIDLIAEPALRDPFPYLVTIPIFVVAIYAFWYVGLIAGGADAKALMAIGVLLPWPVDLGNLPFLPSFMPGSISVLGNSLVAALLVPVALLLMNLVRGDWRLPNALLGYKVPVADLPRRAVWPMQRVVDGKVVTRYFASRGGASVEEVQQELTAAGLDAVWVTPKVPFMIPLLAGFIATFVVGDLLLALIAAVLGLP